MLAARLKYHLDKLKRAWVSGTLYERITRKLKAVTMTTVSVLINYAKLPRVDKRLSVSDGFADHRANTLPSPAPYASDDDLDILRRITTAYQTAKAAQARITGPFQIRGFWSEWINMNYGPLVEALNSQDYERVGRLLENFSREQFAVGTGGAYDDIVHYRTPLLGPLYIKTVWCEYRDKLIDLGFDLSRLSYPLIGNPAGMCLNGNIIQIETLRHAYNACSISHLLKGVSEPVIVEIGGGFGGQAHQILMQCEQNDLAISKYLDFDIPEVQVVASYFLMKAFPANRVRLYGEGAVSAERTEDLNIGIFPHFTIDSLGDLTADLVFSSHSFSEMDSDSSAKYLASVNQICRKYFMHINHEVPFAFKQDDGTISTNTVGSKMVPSHHHFKRIYKRPRVYGRPEDRLFKSFAYLYERFS